MMNKAFERHYSDDLLVAFLDGELSPFRYESVQKHLQACWPCRARLDELEQQILVVTKLVEGDLFPGPHRIAEAHSKFRAWAATIAACRVPRRGARFQGFPLRPAWVISCLVILVGIAWIWFRPRDRKPAPLAVMARVEQAESALLQGPVHQQFRVVAVQVRPLQRRHESRLDVWYEPSRDRFASRLQDDTGTLRHALWRPAPGREYVYNPAKSAGAVPAVNGSPGRVSVDWFLREQLTLEDLEHNLMKWLESRRWKPISLASDFAVMVDDQGSVLSMEISPGGDGGPGLRLLARKSRGPVTLEFMIDVDRQTYRPRLQRIRYATPSTVLELQLIPEGVQALTTANFEPDPFLVKPVPSPLTALPKPKPVAPIVSPGSSAVPDTTALEIEVLYAMHRVRACLGEPLEVVKGPDGTLLVRGITGTAQRKQQLIEALAELAGSARLGIDIRSTEEALQEAGRENLKLTAPSPRASSAPIEKELEKYFAGEGPRASRAAERFSEDAVSLAEELMTEAWALRQLAARFGSGQDRGLSPKSARLLQAMCLDHLNDLRAKTAKARAFVEPVLFTISDSGQHAEAGLEVANSEAAWDSALAPVLDCTKRIHTRILVLFAGGTAPAETRVMVRDVLAGFPELDARLQAAADGVVLSLSRRDLNPRSPHLGTAREDRNSRN